MISTLFTPRSYAINNCLLQLKKQIPNFLWALVQGKENAGLVFQRKFPNFCLSPCYVMYQKCAETSSHLFSPLFCGFKVVYKLCKEANILWIFPGSFDSLLMEYSCACSR